MPGATYEPIATTTLTTSQTSITFSTLGSYTDLRFVIVYTATSSGGELDLRFNGDTATNYSNTELYGIGTSGGEALGTQWTTKNVMYLPGSVGSSTTVPTLVTGDILGYRGTTNNKTVISTWSGDRSGSGASARSVGLWRSTAAITSVVFLLGSGSFATGSTATIYGITKA